MSISALEEQNRNECQISCKLELVPGTHEFEGTMFSSSQTAYVFDDTLCQNKVHLIDSTNLTGHDDTVFPIFEDGAISRDSEHFFWEYKNVLKLHKPMLFTPQGLEEFKIRMLVSQYES